MAIGAASPRLTPLWALLSGCAPIPGPQPTTDDWSAPDNVWPVATPPSGLTGEGFDVGQVLPDVRLADQHGDEVSPWQFYGAVQLVTLGAVWCAPCRDLAEQAAGWSEAWGPRGFVHLTILAEDASGTTPDVADAAAWAEAYGDHAPVLVDPDRAVSPPVSGQFPVTVIVSRDLVVEAVLPGVPDDLASLIEAEL